MNINIENMNTTKFFKDLEIGDTFIHDNIPYMKIIEVIDVDGKDFLNVVDLRNGELTFFAEYVTIQRILIENATAKYIK